MSGLGGEESVTRWGRDLVIFLFNVAHFPNVDVYFLFLYFFFQNINSYTSHFCLLRACKYEYFLTGHRFVYAF
jgi:hypothetical protein